LNIELYLKKNVKSFKLRRSLACFRASYHDNLIEKGRRLNIAAEDRNCKLCNVIEDECHVALHCPLYSVIRKTILNLEELPFRGNNVETFRDLMSSQSPTTVRKLAQYCFAMQKEHASLCSQNQPD
jgi:hypothetical protein